VLFISHEHLLKFRIFRFDTSSTNEQIFIINVIAGLRRVQVGIVIPILTHEALNHVLIDCLLVVRQITMAIQVVVIPIILVFGVGVFFFVGQLAAFRHFAIPAITTEIKLRVELVHLMALVAGQHASEAEAVRLDFILGTDLVILNLLQI
jgi:hypothetical protein